MRLLLDTHILIWSALSPSELGPKAAALISDSKVSRMVSPISTLEIAQLVSKGRLTLKYSVLEWINLAFSKLRLEGCELSHEVAAEAYNLSGDLHPDPADRILVATANLEDAHLITADKRLLKYKHVRCIDARK